MVPPVNPAIAAIHGTHATMVAQAAEQATLITAKMAQLIPIEFKHELSFFQLRPTVTIPSPSASAAGFTMVTFFCGADPVDHIDRFSTRGFGELLIGSRDLLDQFRHGAVAQVRRHRRFSGTHQVGGAPGSSGRGGRSRRT